MSAPSDREVTSKPQVASEPEAPSEPQAQSEPQAPSPSQALSNSQLPSTSQATSTSKPTLRPFPSVTGGCFCNTIRYRLLTSPLFCFACHCPDCQKTTGSAFGLFLNIEASALSVISPTQPALVTQFKRPGLISRHAECPACRVELWSHNSLGPGVADVRVGTLDFPGLMEPDGHAYVESKLGWLRLPEGARAVEGGLDHTVMWPRSSLRRLDACLKGVAEKVGKMEGEDGAGDGERTPTAGEFGEDDEAFERRFRETERGLQGRLERLRRKLEEEGKEEEGKGEDGGLEKLTAKLDIGDGESKGDVGATEKTT